MNELDKEKKKKVLQKEIEQIKVIRKGKLKMRNAQLANFAQVSLILLFVLILQFGSGLKVKILMNFYILIPFILLGILDYYFYKKLSKAGDALRKVNIRLKKKQGALWKLG